MGLGRFGGGIGAAKFLARQDVRVTVTDLKSEVELAKSVAALRDVENVEFHFGGHRVDDFTAADLIVASPAVPPANSFLQLARKRDIPVTTEIALLLQSCPNRVAAVTGSVGKSTTAAMLASIWRVAGRTAHLGGNIGGSLLDVVDEISPEDWLILELSSFQLTYLDELHWAPDIAVVTNFAPNHLDWHGSLESYRQAKQALLRWQRPDQFAVLNALGEVGDWETGAQKCVFGRRRDGADSVWMNGDRLEVAIAAGAFQQSWSAEFPDRSRWPGRHNAANASAAATAALAAGISREAIIEGLMRYPSLPHRLERIGDWNGRSFYNDSKATVPESTLAALESFDCPVILLAGGASKGTDLSSLAAACARSCKAVALIGDTGPALERLIANIPGVNALPPRVAATLADAFDWSVAQSSPGDVILLSPGCASFGWFRDYEDRGEQFRRLVHALTGDQRPL